jgi:hypothetical protein
VTRIGELEIMLAETSNQFVLSCHKTNAIFMRSTVLSVGNTAQVRRSLSVACQNLKI